MIPKRTKDKLIIIGSGRTIYDLSPERKDAELWGNNNCYSLINSPDRWFEIHQIIKDGKIFGKWIRRGSETFGSIDIKRYLKELADLNIPIFMHRKLSLIPLSVEFPFQEILDSYKFHYFTCTISWQLALAIKMGYKEISIFGIDMEEYFERRYQRASVEYFLGMAQGAGIKVNVPRDSPILKAPFLYGFEYENLYQ